MGIPAEVYREKIEISPLQTVYDEGFIMPEPRTLYSMIYHHLQMENINTFIQEVSVHRQSLSFSMSDLIPVIVHLVKNHRIFLSPDTMAALTVLSMNQPDISSLVASLSEVNPPKGQVGRMPLPLTTTIGLVRDIRIDEASSGSAMSDEVRSQLDKVGAAVFQVLKKRLKHPFFWNPKQYRFGILKLDNLEDITAKGSSLELALAICLYSHLTKMPVPANVSATAAVKRNGAVLQVDGLDLKLAALHQERHYITSILVSDRQTLPQPLPPGITICPVKTLEQAIGELFPDPIPFSSVDAQLDLTSEIRKIKFLYDEYYLDSCIQYTTDVIQYLEDGYRKKNIPDQQRIPALFTCYWRKGSCWCHKGNIQRAFVDLKQAIKLGGPVEGKPQYVVYTEYLNCRINFAVILKDVFRYPEAEVEHRSIQEEMEKGHVTDTICAKNLSSWSQLCLAQGKYPDAEALQKEAIQKINPEEKYRNQGYLAQIYFRSGRLDLAKKQLDRASKKLNELSEEIRQKNLPFFHWFFSEFYYRQAALPKESKRQIRMYPLEKVLALYPSVVSYTHALVYKFGGLARLLQGDESTGLELLSQSIDYLEKHQTQPMLHLLGVTVRAERAIYWMGKQQLDKARKDILHIRNFLRSRKDIGHFFKPELDALTPCLRPKQVAINHLEALQQAIFSIINKIPY
jgi:tetratricopeptide (TPR) repeat protein